MSINPNSLSKEEYQYFLNKVENLDEMQSSLKQNIQIFEGYPSDWLDEHADEVKTISILTKKYFQETENLENLMIALIKKNKKIPAEFVKSLKKNEELVASLSQRILQAPEIEGVAAETFIKKMHHANGIARALTEKMDYSHFLKTVSSIDNLDKHGLLIGGDEISKETFQWHLNLGLLMNEYQATKDPEHKKLLGFLAANYLAKASPINLETLEKSFGLEKKNIESFRDLFQIGLFTRPGTYHRSSSQFADILIGSIRKTMAQESTLGTLFLTDTTKITDLFPLSYTVINTSKDDSKMGAEMRQAINEHFALSRNQKVDGYQFLMTKPFLMDFSNVLEKYIVTNQDNKKEKEFLIQLKNIKLKLEVVVEAALEAVKKSNPDLCKTPDDEEKLKVFIKANISCVSRTQWENIGILHLLPVFNTFRDFDLPEKVDSFLGVQSTDHLELNRMLFDQYGKLSVTKISQFVNQTGIRMGAVSARQHVFDFLTIEDLVRSIRDYNGSPHKIVQYGVQGDREKVLFNKPTDILKTSLFQRFTTFAESKRLFKQQPEIAILGRSTLDLVKGLLSEIDEKKWKKLNDNVNVRVLLQTSLFKLMQHLAQAENNNQNFAKFTQAIELAHAEIATLLTLIAPFSEQDFSDIYRKQLTFIPKEFQDNLRIGIANSGMNAFAGINTCVLKGNGKLERVFGEGVYYEEVAFIGKKRDVSNILKQEKIEAIDLYVGEFNHNINVSQKHFHYTAGDIEGDIEKLLQTKTKTKHLTVAVDSTIDFVQSSKAESLLKRFHKEIEEGKLNVVFFRSGQKFDMFGMDNYYGAPFYIVNNGDKQWDSFNMMLDEDVFKTDPLSVQWFCLVNKYAPEALEQYQERIIENTRTILEHVPESLKPSEYEAGTIQVSTVDSKMDPTFIDIKILDDNPEDRADKIVKMFFKKFVDSDSKAHARNSFGFYHPNIDVIPDPEDGCYRNIRINPGLDPKDNDKIIALLKDVAKMDKI